MLSADVEMLTPFLGLDKQLPISQLLFLACLHMAEVGISLLGRSCRRVPVLRGTEVARREDN